MTENPEFAKTCNDRLAALFVRFPVRASLFRAGALCGVADFSAPGDGGRIHLVRDGAVEVVHPGQASLHIDEPSLLLYSRPVPRRLLADAERGATLACAHLHFEGGATNPVSAALPDVICLPLQAIEGADRVLSLLFEEALGANCGRHALVDRLFEVLLIQVLRHLMETRQVHGGMLAGMSDPKLRRALIGMHEQPQRDWSLDGLAGLAGMSRSVFAGAFRRAVGCTPGDYLRAWRVRLAQQALLQGRPLQAIATEVGYGSEAALSRAFSSQCGVSPRAWRQAQTPSRPVPGRGGTAPHDPRGFRQP